MLMYRIENVSGDVLADNFESVDEAKIEARNRLEDDPELGELYVVEIQTTYAWRACHAPTPSMDTMVVVIPYDQKLVPPASGIRAPLLSEEEFDELVNDVYRDNPGKAEGMRQMRDQGLA